MIEVRNLLKVFDTRGQVVRAVDDVSTRVARGEVLVVIGPSGSGKSTFLRCLNGLEEFDEGSVSIDGVDLADPRTDINAYSSPAGARAHPWCRRRACRPQPRRSFANDGNAASRFDSSAW